MSGNDEKETSVLVTDEMIRDAIRRAEKEMDGLREEARAMRERASRFDNLRFSIMLDVSELKNELKRRENERE